MVTRLECGPLLRDNQHLNYYPVIGLSVEGTLGEISRHVLSNARNPKNARWNWFADDKCVFRVFSIA